MAMVQNNLGNALFLMGEDDVSEEGTMQLHKAKRVFEKALAIWAKGQMPLSRAMTHNNLGNVLSALGQRETSAQGGAYLRDSLVAYEQALKEYTADRTYLARDRAMTRYNLGLAQLVLGERENDPVQLGKAVEALRASLPHRQQPPRVRAQTERNLGLALYQCGRMERAPTEIPSRWKEAAAAFRSAIEHYGLAGETFEVAVTGIRLGLVLTEWAAREGTREARLARWREAIEVFEEALRVPGLENHSDHYGAVQRHLWEAQRREAEVRAQAGTGSL
jgi:tetratricopeptide (TPR) repeat protein